MVSVSGSVASVLLLFVCGEFLECILVPFDIASVTEDGHKIGYDDRFRSSIGMEAIQTYYTLLYLLLRSLTHVQVWIHIGNAVEDKQRLVSIRVVILGFDGVGFDNQ